MGYLRDVWVIVNGGAYVRTIDPVHGTARWTEDAAKAKAWSAKHVAEMFADGVGHVRPLTVADGAGIMEGDQTAPADSIRRHDVPCPECSDI